MAIDFGRYIHAEIEAIKKFRDQESKHIGRQLSNDEAVQRWISSGKADQFRRNYEVRRKNG